MLKSFEMLMWLGNSIGKPPGYERIVRWIAPPVKCRLLRDICVIRDGSAFLAQPSVPLGWHVAFFGTYEPELRKIIRLTLPSGGAAIDVGANIGWHTLLMARCAGKQGTVLAAEANPSVRSRLEENLHLNALNNVQIIPHAISSDRGKVQFFGPQSDDASSGDGYIVAQGGEHRDRIITIETRSLDEIVNAAGLAHVNLIKIDVEGFEWPVFKGAEATIARTRPHILFEFNAEYTIRGGGSVEQFNDFFMRHRYRLFAIGSNSSQVVVPNNWPDCADIWAMPQA